MKRFGFFTVSKRRLFSHVPSKMRALLIKEKKFYPEEVLSGRIHQVCPGGRANSNIGRFCSTPAPLLEQVSAKASKIDSPAHVAAKLQMNQLLQHFTQTTEVRQYLKYFASLDSQHFAVVRLSGDILHREDYLAEVASSLAFLHRVGLKPVVVHGAGIFTGRRSEEVRQAMLGGRSDLALEYMLTCNSRLVAALRTAGVAAQSITTQAFEAEVSAGSATSRAVHSEGSSHVCLDLPTDLCGRVMRVDVREIDKAVSEGKLPVIASLGRRRSSSSSSSSSSTVEVSESNIPQSQSGSDASGKRTPREGRANRKSTWSGWEQKDVKVYTLVLLPMEGALDAGKLESVSPSSSESKMSPLRTRSQALSKATIRKSLNMITVNTDFRHQVKHTITEADEAAVLNDVTAHASRARAASTDTSGGSPPVLDLDKQTGSDTGHDQKEQKNPF